jgi:hypothetical protein
LPGKGGGAPEDPENRADRNGMSETKSVKEPPESCGSPVLGRISLSNSRQTLGPPPRDGQPDPSLPPVTFARPSRIDANEIITVPTFEIAGLVSFACLYVSREADETEKRVRGYFTWARRYAIADADEL